MARTASDSVVSAAESSENDDRPHGAYNATVAEVRQVHDRLRVLRVHLDEPPPEFAPGQWVTLGLGAWEPRVDASAEPINGEPTSGDTLIRRAYSLSARVLDDHGLLLPPHNDKLWEFYVSLVIGSPEHPAALTPRLFALRPGSRLFVSRLPKGHYSTAGVMPDDDLIFAATGTGEAPHNAMIADLLSRGHRGRIVSVVGVRYENDLAYRDAHRRLEQLFPHFVYRTFTSREPRNLDATRGDFVGKQYVQNFFASDEWARVLEREPNGKHSHVFACGNPAMVSGVRALLEARGFVADHAGRRGNFHFEQYGE